MLPLNSPEKEKLIKAILKALKELHQRARDMHIHQEAETRKRDWVGMYNLRDAGDHLRRLFLIIFEEEDTWETIERGWREYGEMVGHYNRAINEGAQNVAEVLLKEVLEKRRPQILYKLSFVSAPTNREIDEMLELVKEKMEISRKAKPDDASLYFEDAVKILKELNSRLPHPSEMKYRLVTIFLTLAVGVGAFFAGIVIK